MNYCCDTQSKCWNKGHLSACDVILCDADTHGVRRLEHTHTHSWLLCFVPRWDEGWASVSDELFWFFAGQCVTHHPLWRCSFRLKGQIRCSEALCLTDLTWNWDVSLIGIWFVLFNDPTHSWHSVDVKLSFCFSAAERSFTCEVLENKLCLLRCRNVLCLDWQ